MVQVTFDTNNDSLEELEHALQLLQKAIAKHTGSEVPHKHAQEDKVVEKEHTELKKELQKEEEEDYTPFIKITIKHDDDESDSEEKKAPATHHAKAPTLNQLINDASITEEELSSLFKTAPEGKAEHGHKEHNAHAPKETSEDGTTYLEIIEYDEEKK
jgi:hypothetical protein